MNSRRMNTLRIAAVLVASVALSRTVSAEPYERHDRFTTAQVSRTIDGTGYDLSTPAGAQRLYRHVVATAKVICLSPQKHLKGVARAKHERDHARRCFDDAVNGALAQISASTGTDIERVAGLDRFREAGLVASR